MSDPPRSDEPNSRSAPSWRRRTSYGAVAILALVMAILTCSCTSSQRPPSQPATGSSTAASSQPPQEASPPQESGQSQPGATGGGGGAAETPHGPGGGGRPVEAAPPPPPPPPPAPEHPSVAPQIPPFPWPPPRASAIVVLPAAFLRPTEAALHFGDVDRTLTSALDSCGYSERGYYAVPDGFAIVTRLEQMEADGTSKAPPGRWALEYKPLATFSLSSYVRALFTADPGFYRIIVFVVTSQSFSERPSGVSREKAMQWLQSGLNRLPADVAGREYTDQYACTALIYQFEQPGSGEGARLDVPSDLPGRIHLERAKLWEALGKPAIGY